MGTDFRILVALDLRAGTDQLLAEARLYANAFSATLDIIHVAEPDPDFVGYIKGDGSEKKPTQEDLIRDNKASELRSEHANAQAIGATLRAGGFQVGQVLTVEGPILETILEHASKLGSSLLILGSRQHSALYRLWYGDTAAGAAKQPPCPLLVVPI